jgi:hypothetical protein
MNDLTKIEKIELSEEQLGIAIKFLKKAGQQQYEAVALFAGQKHNSIFKVEEVILPYQTSYKLEEGLMYAVDGEELHRINQYLFENNMELIAQIHSHPREAFHSSSDDRFPIVDTFGGISIVVPDFATGPINLKYWAIYRLSINGNWDSLGIADINDLFKLI